MNTSKQLFLILALVAITCSGCQIARSVWGKVVSAGNSVLDYSEGISTNVVKTNPIKDAVVK